jgi:hypothetical protein
MTHRADPQLGGTLVGWAVDEAATIAKRFGTGIGAHIVEVLAICGNAWAAANMYEELSRLSDAELERRGIPRAALGRRVFEAMAGHGSADASGIAHRSAERCRLHVAHRSRNKRAA